MSGREKMEAALGPAGTADTPVVICYEGIYTRDHWEQITERPWWHVFAPEIERQVGWRAEVIERTGQDWFVLPRGPSARERESVRVEERPEGVFRIDLRTGEELSLIHI